MFTKAKFQIFLFGLFVNVIFARIKNENLWKNRIEIVDGVPVTSGFSNLKRDIPISSGIRREKHDYRAYSGISDQKRKNFAVSPEILSANDIYFPLYHKISSQNNFENFPIYYGMNNNDLKNFQAHSGTSQNVFENYVNSKNYNPIYQNFQPNFNQRKFVNFNSGSSKNFPGPIPYSPNFYHNFQPISNLGGIHSDLFPRVHLNAKNNIPIFQRVKNNSFQRDQNFREFYNNLPGIYSRGRRKSFYSVPNFQLTNKHSFNFPVGLKNYEYDDTLKNVSQHFWKLPEEKRLLPNNDNKFQELYSENPEYPKVTFNRNAEDRNMFVSTKFPRPILTKYPKPKQYTHVEFSSPKLEDVLEAKDEKKKYKVKKNVLKSWRDVAMKTNEDKSAKTAYNKNKRKKTYTKQKKIKHNLTKDKKENYDYNYFTKKQNTKKRKMENHHFQPLKPTSILKHPIKNHDEAYNKEKNRPENNVFSGQFYNMDPLNSRIKSAALEYFKKISDSSKKTSSYTQNYEEPENDPTKLMEEMGGMTEIHDKKQDLSKFSVISHNFLDKPRTSDTEPFGYSIGQVFQTSDPASHLNQVQHLKNPITSYNHSEDSKLLNKPNQYWPDNYLENPKYPSIHTSTKSSFKYIPWIPESSTNKMYGYSEDPKLSIAPPKYISYDLPEKLHDLPQEFPIKSMLTPVYIPQDYGSHIEYGTNKTEYETMPNLIKNKIRSLIKFPTGTTMTLTFTLSIPNSYSKIPDWSYVMTYRYFLELTQLNDLLNGKVRKKRSLLNHDRFSIYHIISAFVQGLGHNGEACMQRAVCDMGIEPLDEFSLYGEILRLIFTPGYGNLNSSCDMTYAQNLGSINGTCQKYYKNCQLSIKELLYQAISNV